MAAYTFEGSTILAPVTFLSNDRVISSETASLKQLIHRTDAQRWDLSFTVLTNDNSANLLLAMLDNSYTVKTMPMLQLPQVESSTTTTGVISAIQTVPLGSSSVVCSGRSGVIPKGSFIQFSNHSKIYITTSDWNGVFNSNNNTYVDTINVFPTLRSLVPINTVVRYCNSSTKPQYNYLRSVDNVSGITFNDGVLSSPGTITLQEVI